MYYIGIDLGGTTIKFGLVDSEGHILFKHACPTMPERGFEAVVRDMCAGAKDVAEKNGVAFSEVVSVGVGIPGLPDRKTRRIPTCTNLFWTDVPLEETMEQALKKPVHIENDATVAAFAESVAGISKGVKNSVFITLGTGVGGGIVLDGKIFSGSHGVGSEIGHMVIRSGGEKCNCGHTGCWERYVSATALIKFAREAAMQDPDGGLYRAVEGDLDRMNAKTVIDLAKKGDAQAEAIFKNYVHDLCAGLATLVNILDPEMFVLGGGVSHAGAFLLDAVRAELSNHIFCREMPFAEVNLAVLGNDAGIIGAAMLGRESTNEAGI